MPSFGVGEFTQLPHMVTVMLAKRVIAAREVEFTKPVGEECPLSDAILTVMGISRS